MRSEYLTSHRAIREAMGSASAAVLLVSGDSSSIHALTALAHRHDVDVRPISRRQLRSFAPDARDCALEVRGGPSSRRSTVATLDEVLAEADAQTGLLLVLDHITDPHNFGAILRSADQFGVDAVIVPGRRAAPLSAVAIQASAGTAPYVPLVTVANLASVLPVLQEAGFWVFAAEASGEPAHRTNLTGRTALVLGSEGKGVSRLVAERCDGAVSIPMRGHADSLNVSVAGGVLLYEARRQQRWLDPPPPG